MRNAQCELPRTGASTNHVLGDAELLGHHPNIPEFGRPFIAFDAVVSMKKALICERPKAP